MKERAKGNWKIGGTQYEFFTTPDYRIHLIDPATGKEKEFECLEEFVQFVAAQEEKSKRMPAKPVG
jgi:hypothetical protein